MTGSLVLSSSAGIYYPLPQKGRSAQRPARGVQPPAFEVTFIPIPHPWRKSLCNITTATTRVNDSGTSPLPVTERRRQTAREVGPDPGVGPGQARVQSANPALRTRAVADAP